MAVGRIDGRRVKVDRLQVGTLEIERMAKPRKRRR
jgi:hypothetical protein